MSKKIERALIANDAKGTAFVIATDGESFAFLIDEVSTQIDDFISMDVPSEPGIYLFTGEITSESYSYEYPDERETVAKGEVRRIRPEELEELLKMTPPVPEDERDE